MRHNRASASNVSQHTMRQKYKSPDHTGVAFLTRMAGEPSVDVVLLAMHIYTALHTQAMSLSIVLVQSEACWRRNQREVGRDS